MWEVQTDLFPSKQVTAHRQVEKLRAFIEGICLKKKSRKMAQFGNVLNQVKQHLWLMALLDL